MLHTCANILEYFWNTVEPHYNEVLWTMKITLLYQVSHYIRVKKQRNIKSWDQKNDLVIRGFCYIRPLYNEVSTSCTVVLCKNNLLLEISNRMISNFLYRHVGSYARTLRAINVCKWFGIFWNTVENSL